jgi:hypothetical protein
MLKLRTNPVPPFFPGAHGAQTRGTRVENVFNIVGLWDSRKKSKKPMKIGCSIMSHYVKAREKGRDGVLDETINHTMNHPFFFN